MLDGYERVKNDYESVKKISYSTSRVALTVGGIGDLRVGGVAGYARNVSIADSRSHGKIDVDISNGGNIANLYVGGFAGMLYKYYGAAVKVLDLDPVSSLYSYNEITVDIIGGAHGKLCAAGGLFGSITNQRISNSRFAGSLKINTTMFDISAGGIAGEAKNTSGLFMSIRGVDNKGSVTVSSGGTVYAGGIAGRTVSTVYSDIVGTSAPVVTTQGAYASAPIVSEYVAVADEQ